MSGSLWQGWMWAGILLAAVAGPATALEIDPAAVRGQYVLPAEPAGRGIRHAIAAATSAAPAAISSATWKARKVGTSCPRSVIVIPASTAPITALLVEVPRERASALMPLAAAVSETGTAALINAGNDEKAKPTPTLTEMLSSIIFSGLPSSVRPPR